MHLKAGWYKSCEAKGHGMWLDDIKLFEMDHMASGVRMVDRHIGENIAHINDTKGVAA